MKEGWIQSIEDMVIQIATPYNRGTGIMLHHKSIIITNEHVVRDNKQVVVEGKHLPRSSAKVVFIDEKYDIAFLLLHQAVSIDLPNFEIKDDLVLGETVYAFGHPLGLKFCTTQGILSSIKYPIDGINYLQHDATLNPGNSGGPLFSSEGKLIGINTFMHKDGQNIGLSLPATHIVSKLEAYFAFYPKAALVCHACQHMIVDDINVNYCSQCGDAVKMISHIDDYQPIGMDKQIEDVITALGYNVETCRRGNSTWEIKEGSAMVNITYHIKSGYIIADAILCYLPMHNIIDIYTYLLKQNHHNKGISFSIKDSNILLSSLIYDQQMHIETCKSIVSKLIKKADQYDDILINQFGAKHLDESR